MSPARARGEAGSVAVETAVIAPALVALLLLVVFARRVSQAEAEVRRAAADGARAASLEYIEGTARDAANARVEANLREKDVVCAELSTDVDTSELAPGGRVVVTVRCVADMADIVLLGVTGQRRFIATSIEVVDRYRGGAPGRDAAMESGGM
jgi:Flp pilus assembly protein TadG